MFFVCLCNVIDRNLLKRVNCSHEQFLVHCCLCMSKYIGMCAADEMWVSFFLYLLPDKIPPHPRKINLDWPTAGGRVALSWGWVVQGGRTNCSNNIVPNRALPTLEMRPFQLAKCRKIRDLTLIFWKIFWGIAPPPDTGEGLRRLSPYSTPSAFRCFASPAAIAPIARELHRQEAVETTSWTFDFSGLYTWCAASNNCKPTLTLYRTVMPIGTPFLKEKINN